MQCSVCEKEIVSINKLLILKQYNCPDQTHAEFLLCDYCVDTVENYLNELRQA